MDGHHASYDQNVIMMFVCFCSVVVLRKANKIGFIVRVTPQNEAGEVKVSTYCYSRLTFQTSNLHGFIVWV